MIFNAVFYLFLISPILENSALWTDIYVFPPFYFQQFIFSVENVDVQAPVSRTMHRVFVDTNTQTHPTLLPAAC